MAYLDGTTGTSTFELRRRAFAQAAAERGIQVPDGARAATTINVALAATLILGEAKRQTDGFTGLT